MASRILPQSVPIGKSGSLVFWGFGVKCNVDKAHLRAEWGVGLQRFQTRISRVEGRKLCRVVLISSDGYITLEALRWITDVGASFTMLDRRGKLHLVSSPSAPSDSRLRRAQSLALQNGTALRISRELIRQKVEGQELLVRNMLHDSATADAIARFRSTLPSAENIERVMLIEAQAAKLYWQSWADLPILWPRRDETRIPEHWKKFGSRISPLTHSPRLAANPPNALLNLLYGILESEARISAIAMGMDPAIGFLHADTPNRDSLACDIMEVCRPRGVDAFVLNWLQSEPLRRSDFWEDRDGNCRIVSSLAIKLCETSDTWRRLLAPVAEYVGQEIWSSVFKQTCKAKLTRQLIATRLTQRHEGRGNTFAMRSNPLPRWAKICKVCGAEGVKNRYCKSCAVEVSRENMAQVALIGHSRPKTQRVKNRISKRVSDHAVANTWWDPKSLPSWLTEEFYVQRIQPSLRSKKVREIAEAMRVSQPYAALIRSGRRCPHPRHWLALARLAGLSQSAS
jgi:CRISPR-associated endonuclease Cas1